ncbi:MAG: alkaline-phosphatase-like protein [Paenibacillus sp.]|nr:alkaline-phosphatase-like protein [Paenibacillus sp.]
MIERHKAGQKKAKEVRSSWITTFIGGLAVGLVALLFVMSSRNAVQPTALLDAEHSAAEKGRRITIVAVPGWSFLDWSDERLRELPHLRRLIAEGAIGAMNIRAPEKGLEDVYATLGAGAPAISSADYGAWNADEANEGYALYRRLTGLDAQAGSVLLPDIAAIRRRNDSETSHSSPGLLGEMLRRNGIRAAVFGNSDLSLERKRYAPLMLMDEQGLVPQGDVDSRMLMSDVEAPYGVRANAAELLQAIRIFDNTAEPAASSVKLVEWGDLLRYESEAKRYDAAVAQTKKLDALRRLDAFVGELRSGQSSVDALWLFSPFVGAEAAQRKMSLAPVLFSATEGALGGGLLTSPSTRRDGIVTAADMAPTLLSALGIEAPSPMVGRVMAMSNHSEPLSYLRQQLITISEVYRTRPRILIPFVSVEAIILLAALAFVWGKFAKASLWMEAFLLSLLVAPLSLLGIGWIGYSLPLSVTAQTALFVASVAAAACAFAAMRRRSALLAAALLSCITVAALFIDGMTGAEAMKRSVLGYDSIIGARYYGMGNEFMGVFVGAATFAFAAAMELGRTRRPSETGSGRSRIRRAAAWSAAAFAAALLYLAAPQLGTNAGGAITAAVAFGLAWLASFTGPADSRASLRRLMLICAALIAAGLAALWLLNVAAPIDAGRQSHIGRAIAQLAAGHTDWIAAMIARKLHMNVHLIGVSVWTKVFVASLLAIAAVVIRPRGVFRRWERRHPFYMSGFIAITLGSIVALAFNDSGIVAAATMILYAAVPMLLLGLQDNRSDQDDSSSHSA